MNRLLTITIMMGLTASLMAEPAISVPWEEYRGLLRESIERKLKAMIETEPEASPQVHTLSEAVYTLSLGKGPASGQLLVSGQVLSGTPERIPLFGSDIIISGVDTVSGGSLLCGDNDEGQVAFLPNGTNDFQLSVRFLVPVQEDSVSRFVRFAVPRALRNAMTLVPGKDVRLIESPGVPDADGVRHFAAASSVTIRFSADADIARATVAEVDSLSRVRIQGKRAIVTTHFLPVQAPPSVLILDAPAAAYVGSSLKRSEITAEGNGRYELSLPADSRERFWVQFAMAEQEGGEGFAFRLPSLRDNNGKSGNVILEEPDDGQVSLGEEPAASRLPVTGLRAPLRDLAGTRRSYLRLPPESPLAFSVKRYASVSTPRIVLDSLRFFSSFEENGNVLSVLSLQVPAEAGPRLRLKSVPGAQVWRLTVNGRRKDVYSDDTGMWIVPLGEDKTSNVELAFLRKGDKLGLRGRLESEIPETGLPANEVNVGVALPESKQLLSLDGPLTPDGQHPWQTPREFLGRRYFFKSKFHKGEGLAFAVSYRELTPEEAARMPVPLNNPGVARLDRQND